MTVDPQDVQNGNLLTRPPLAGISPTHPESAETASSPMDAPCPMCKAAASMSTENEVRDRFLI